MADGGFAVASSKETYTFSGRLCQWKVDPKLSPLEWIMVTIPFEIVEKWFFLQTYRDADKKEKQGFQRLQTPSHVKKLWSEMDSNHYTPAVWAACTLPSHKKTTKVDRESGEVSIVVNANAKLAIIDGGHRRKALIDELDMLRAKLGTDNAKKETKDDAQNRINTILATEISIQVFLDPSRLQEHFLNLQKGRPPDRDMVRSMEEQNGLLGTKQSVANFTRELAHLLAEDNESFLYGQIKFDSAHGGSIHYASIVTFTTSEFATTLTGGGRLCLACQPQKEASWLHKVYDAVFYALKEYGSKTEDDKPQLFRPDYLLTPNGIMSGTRGGSAFLVGLGNMLAFRMIMLGHETATEEDLRLLTDVAENVFNRPHTGQSANDKRKLMSDFAQQFFADLEADDIHPNFRGIGMHEGIPIPLLETLSYSTFGVKNPNKGKQPAPTGPMSPIGVPVLMTPEHEAELAEVG